MSPDTNPRDRDEPPIDALARRSILAAGVAGVGVTAGCLGGETDQTAGGDGTPTAPDAAADTPGVEETPLAEETTGDRDELEILASATLGSDPTFDGIEVIRNVGGDSERQLRVAEHVGEEGWSTDEERNADAFVVDVGPSIETDPDETAVIRLRYFDAGSGGVKFVYGGLSGPTSLEEFDLTLEDTGEWKVYELAVDAAVVSNDALFNANRDFLLRPGPELTISRIEIAVRPREGPPKQAEVPIQVGQGSIGSVYVDGETPTFDLTTEASVDAIEWTATDYWGAQVASGSESVDGEGNAAFELDVGRGYYELDLTAIRGGSAVGLRIHTVGKLEEYDFSGVEDSMFGMVSHFNDGDVMELVELSGTKTIRDSNSWASVEREQGEYTYQDRYVEIREAADRHDVDTLLTMGYGNDHYYQFTAGNDHTMPPDAASQEAYARYANDVLEQYGDRAVAALLWNEPNWLFGSDEIDTSPERYVSLIEGAAPVIEDAHPDVPVLGGAVARAASPFEYSRRVFELGAAEYLDGWTFHPYRHGQRPESEGPQGIGSTEAEIRHMREMVTEGGAPEDFPLYITEIGHRTGIPGVSEGTTTRRQQSQWIARTYTMGKAAGLERLCHYKFRDGLQTSKGPGILHHKAHPWGNRTPKPAYVTYSVLTRRLTNATFAGKDDLPTGAYSYRFADAGRTGDRTTRVMWTAEEAQEVTIETDSPITVTNAIGEQQIYAPRDGEIYLTLSEYVLYATGEIGGISAGTPVSISAPDVAAGETIPVTLASEGPTGEAAVAGKLASLQPGETTVDVAGPETPPHSGVRVLSADLADGGRPFARLQAEVAVSEALEAHLVPRIADAEAGTARLDVQVTNNARTASFTATGIEWTAGGGSGSVSFDQSVPAGETTTLSAPLEDMGELAPYGGGESARAIVTFADRDSLSVTGAVAINPVWRASPSIDGSIDVRDRESIALTADGTISIDDHGGPSDLGGDVWLTWDDDALTLSAAITDDEHVQERTGGGTWRSDSIQLAVAPIGADEITEINVALTPQGPDVFSQRQPSGSNRGPVSGASAEIERDDGAGTTTYEVAIPWDALRVSPGDGAFRTAFIVNDDDGSGREGYVWWGGDIGSGKDVGRLTTAQLVSE